VSVVQYWPVGSTSDTTLTLIQGDISRFLLTDWLPDLPVSISQSIMGWPQYLIEVETGVPRPYLYLSRIAGWSERQWKVVLSWMLGVVGTRRVLANENYSHIAPCSAFYPERKQLVSIPSWVPKYPPSILEIDRNPTSKSRLRPDYIAARSGPSGNYEFAIVESKGIKQSLQNLNSCPTGWKNQSENAIVKIDGLPTTIPRHLVVATRCNPNAKRKQARRLQIRAWNSQTNHHSTDNRILVEIVSAHYVALLRNLGLIENIRALGLSAFARLEKRSATQRALAEANQRADSELLQVLKWTISGREDAYHIISAENISIKVQIAQPVLSLISGLRSEISFAGLDSMIGSHLAAIEEWYSSQINRHTNHEQVSIDRSGFLVITSMMERR
jgi:hypothetical protein